MPIVYRGMLKAVPGPAPSPPATGDVSGNTLGVRNADVVTHPANGQVCVNPTSPNGHPQGMSVAPGSGCNLPAWRRPSGAPWNGTGRAGLVVYEIDTVNLVPVQLAYALDPGNNAHGFITVAAVDTPLATYRGWVAGTAGQWAQAPAPGGPCPPPPPEEEQMGSSPELEELAAVAASAAASGDPTELVTQLISRNRAGLSRESIVMRLQAQAQEAEAAGDDVGAETLRSALDRIAGWCAPDQRIDLT